MKDFASLFDSDNLFSLHSRLSKSPIYKAAAWISFCFTVFTLLLISAFLVLLNNSRFHRYLLTKAQAQASDSLGVRVQLQDFVIHLSTLSADLYGVTVDGASPYANPPLLQIDHVEVGVRVVSILHKAWYFDSIRIDRPIARIIIDSQGRSNIPLFKRDNNDKSNISVFDLGIRHALLDQGEIYCNNHRIDVAVDLNNVLFQSSFNNLLQQYSGVLDYSDSTVQYGAMWSIPHSLEIEFDATPTAFNLAGGRVTAGASQLFVSGVLQNYSSPRIQGHYELIADGKQIANLLRSPSVPTGQMRSSGVIQFEQTAGHSWLDALMMNGNITSDRLLVNTASVRTEIRNLNAIYSLEHGNATIQDLRAYLLGGVLAGQGTMQNIGGNPHSSLSIEVRGASLAAVRQAINRSTVPSNIKLLGSLNASATATWGRTLDDLVAHTEAKIGGQLLRGQVAMTPGLPQAAIYSVPYSVPVNGVVRATYSAINREVALDQSYLSTPQTSLTMNGVVSGRSSLKLNIQANDLREVAMLRDVFTTSSSVGSLELSDLSGRASFIGTVDGSTIAPHLRGSLTATDVHFNGTDWKLLRTSVELNSSLLSLQHAELDAVSHGHILFNGSAGLTRWSFTSTSPIQVKLLATQMNISDIGGLAHQQIPASGLLNADIDLHGTELMPIGTGNVTLNNATAYMQPIQSAKVSFSSDGQATHCNLTVQLPAGILQGKATVQPNLRSYTAELIASGVQIDQLQALKSRNISASGVLVASFSGQGTFANPEMRGTIEIPTLAFAGQTVTGLQVQMNVADHVGSADVSASAANTSVRAQARINLSGDYLADASLDTQAISLQPLLEMYAPQQASEVTGETQLHATLHGPLKNKNLMEAHLTIPVLKVAYSNTVQLAAASPILIDYKNGVITLQRSAIHGTDTDIEFQGAIAENGKGPMSLSVHGAVNLQIAQLFDPEVRSSGQLKLNIDSHGSVSGSSHAGQIEIVDANFASEALPAGLQHGNGVLTLTQDHININNFQGFVGGGKVTAQGGIAYRPAIQFGIGMQAQDVRVLYPQGMRESLNANLRLVGSKANAQLSGSVNLSDLSFTPAFDLNSFISQFSGGVVLPPKRGLAQDIGLNISVHSTNNVNLVSRTLSVGGSANLVVRGSLADPVVLGRVNLDRGDIILNGNRFVLDGGTIQFINPAQTQPVVNLTLNTRIQQYDINLRFRGPIDHLHTAYNSDPSLPSADIINLLALGQTTEASAANPAPSPNQAAESLVASQVSSQVSSRVSRIAGISQLSINPVLAGSSSQGPPGANITIQQRVTGNLFVTFSTNVASTQSQTIQGQYQVSPRVALSATRDPNGGFALDTVVKKSW